MEAGENASAISRFVMASSITLKTLWKDLLKNHGLDRWASLACSFSSPSC